MSRHLRADQVATELSVEVSTIYRWARLGLIPATRINGTTLRIPEREYRAWLARQQPANV